MKFLNWYIKRATGFLVALFFVFALDAKESLENYKDLISKAENLTIQHDRLKASQVLLQGLAKEKKLSPAWRALKNHLDEISTVFFADKTQKIYELAQSMYYSNAPQALSKYQQGLAMEPDNLELIAGAVRAHLALKQCTSAKELIAKGLGINPFYSDLLLLDLKTRVCLSDYENFENLFNEREADLKSQRAILLVTKATWKWATGQASVAKQIIDLAIKEDPQFSEGYYLKWKIAKELQPTQAATAAERYLSICKNVTGKLRRKYANEPHLCQAQVELETYLNELSPPTDQ